MGPGRAEAKGCGWGGQKRMGPSALSNRGPSSSGAPGTLPRSPAEFLDRSGRPKLPVGPRAALRQERVVLKEAGLRRQGVICGLGRGVPSG